MAFFGDRGGYNSRRKRIHGTGMSSRGQKALVDIDRYLLEICMWHLDHEASPMVTLAQARAQAQYNKLRERPEASNELFKARKSSFLHHVV
jgi:hypothetical protein